MNACYNSSFSYVTDPVVEADCLARVFVCMLCVYEWKSVCCTVDRLDSVALGGMGVEGSSSITARYPNNRFTLTMAQLHTAMARQPHFTLVDRRSTNRNCAQRKVIEAIEIKIMGKCTC